MVTGIFGFRHIYTMGEKSSTQRECFSNFMFAMIMFDVRFDLETF